MQPACFAGTPMKDPNFRLHELKNPDFCCEEQKFPSGHENMVGGEFTSLQINLE